MNNILVLPAKELPEDVSIITRRNAARRKMEQFAAKETVRKHRLERQRKATALLKHLGARVSWAVLGAASAMVGMCIKSMDFWGLLAFGIIWTFALFAAVKCDE